LINFWVYKIILFQIINYLFILVYKNKKETNGDWGLGIGDWGLGIGPNPQSPIPNPQSPIPNPHKLNQLFKKICLIKIK